MNNEWRYVPLSEAVDVLDTLRKPINSKERAARIEGKAQSELYPYYGATGQVGFIDDYITDGEYVLLGEDGAPFLNSFANKAYVISGKAWVNNHAHVLCSKGSNKFLCYYLNYFNYKGYVSGTTRLKLTQAQMKTIPVPVLPLDEQERIVARIEELFSELDNGVETLRKTKQQLAVYRQAVMKVVFQGVAQNHVMVSMGEILSGIEGGKSFKCEERPPQETEYGIIKVSAVTWGTFKEEESKTCQSSQFIESKRIEAGDFLFSRANTLELVGNCVVVETVNKNLMLSDKILRFHFEDGILPKYVMYYLRTHEGKKQIQEYSTGNQESMRNIGQDRIKKINVPECSMEEQNRVVSEIETRLSVCDSIEKTVDTALQQAEAMRQSILKKAFEGRI